MGAGVLSGSFVSAQALENLYKQITKGFANPPNVQVVQSAARLPFAAPGDVRGVHWKGTVYLVAGNIGSTVEAQEVIAHELIGHYGLAGFFGRELSDVLDEIHVNQKLGNQPARGAASLAPGGIHIRQISQ